MSIELAVVVMVLSTIIVTGLMKYRDELRMSVARAVGEQIKVVNDAVATYATTYFSELVNGLPVPGVATPTSPTIPELVTLGYLSGSYSATSISGSAYGIALTLEPVGCTPPNCNIAGMVHLRSPLMDTDGRIDYASLGDAVGAAGTDAGFSLPDVPASIAGLNGSWTLPNPEGAAAGILAMRNGAGSMAFMQFLRRDGSLPMTGPLHMGNQNITNAATVALGTVVTKDDACPTNGVIARDAEGSVMSCQSGRWKKQASYWEDPVATFANLPACNANASGQTRVALAPTTGSGPRAYTCNGSAWQALALDDSGNLVVPGTATINDLAGNLRITPIAVKGGACTSTGQVAQDGTGVLLSCQLGTWKIATGSVKVTAERFWATFCPSETIPYRQIREIMGGMDRFVVTSTCELQGKPTFNSFTYPICSLAAGSCGPIAEFGTNISYSLTTAGLQIVISASGETILIPWIN